jgi:hypothetical protein
MSGCAVNFLQELDGILVFFLLYAVANRLFREIELQHGHIDESEENWECKDQAPHLVIHSTNVVFRQKHSQKSGD